MKRSHRRLLIGGIGVLAAGSIAATVVVLTGTAQEAPPKTHSSAKTETVTRGELTERVSVKGTLAFTNAHDIGTSLGGTVTGVPAIGSVIGRGGELFRIDDRPVNLIIGDLPVWRSFAPGMTAGRDVMQLEQNLADLGYFGFTPDENFDWNTTAAIGAWEKGQGLAWTGQLEQGSVVSSPGEVRVSSIKLPVGSAAGESILGVSSTTKQVSAMASTSLRGVLAEGAPVTVALPDGTQAEGTIVSVGAPVEQERSSGEKSVKLPVTVTLNDPAVAEQYFDVGVTLTVTRVLSEDALLLPVTALLAQPGGGFAVEVETTVKDGASTKIVAVELGAFADGFVEVTGGKLAAGDRVVVAK